MPFDARNTESSGGTRYSEGKPKLMWTPAIGLLKVRPVAVWMMLRVTPPPAVMLEESLCRVLSLGPLIPHPESGEYEVAHLAYLLLTEGWENPYAHYEGFIHGVSRVTEMGAEKYAPHDWHVGQSFSTLVNSGARHTMRAIISYHSVDPESGLEHRFHGAWNWLCLLTFIREGRAEELDDLTPWVDVTTDMKAHVDEAQHIIENGVASDGTPLPPENPRPDERTGHCMGR